MLQPASPQRFVHTHTMLATGLAISPSCPLSQKSLDLDPRPTLPLLPIHHEAIEHRLPRHRELVAQGIVIIKPVSDLRGDVSLGLEPVRI